MLLCRFVELLGFSAATCIAYSVGFARPPNARAGGAAFPSARGCAEAAQEAKLWTLAGAGAVWGRCRAFWGEAIVDAELFAPAYADADGRVAARGRRRSASLVRTSMRRMPLSVSLSAYAHPLIQDVLS